MKQSGYCKICLPNIIGFLHGRVEDLDGYIEKLNELEKPN